MFKYVVGNNGRTIYGGTVVNSDASTISIQGSEWDKDSRANLLYQWDNLAIDPEMVAKGNTNIPVGEFVLCSILPHRSDPSKGTAEEIARLDSALKITNEKGNEKLVIYGKVVTKKWSQSKKTMSIALTNIRDIDGNFLGNPSVSQNGETNYWLNVTAFASNPSIQNHYDAHKCDTEIDLGDTVAMVVQKQINEYKGKTYTNYMLNKYSIVQKAPNKEQRVASAMDSYEAKPGMPRLVASDQAVPQMTQPTQQAQTAPAPQQVATQPVQTVQQPQPVPQAQPVQTVQTQPVQQAQTAPAPQPVAAQPQQAVQSVPQTQPVQTVQTQPAQQAQTAPAPQQVATQPQQVVQPVPETQPVQQGQPVDQTQQAQPELAMASGNPFTGDFGTLDLPF